MLMFEFKFMSDVAAVIENAFRGLLALLCEIIYPLLASLYDLFMKLGTKIYVDDFAQVYNKISLVIGVFMVFRVIFWLIEMMVNPDHISDKEKGAGKLVQKIMVTVVMLAVTPRIFKYALDLQVLIIENNVIERIIAPGTMPEHSEVGNYLAAELFTSFYTVNEVENLDPGDCAEYVGEGGIHYSNLNTYGKFTKLNNFCLTKRYSSDKKDDGDYYPYIIDFSGIYAVGVGGVVCWMILMYCISVGTRYAQLIFLQIVAPIPIMCNLVPGKDNMFQKWIKQCTTTYLDLFIRVTIISFTLLLSVIILSNNNNVLELSGSPGDFWVQLFLVLGLLTFGKKAPDLIQELLPSSVTKASGDFGLSLKKRTEGMIGGNLMYGTLKRAPGYVAGGIAGGIRGLRMGIAGGKGFGSRLAGGISGMARGFATGSKKGNMFKNLAEVKKNQAARNSKLQQWRIAAGKGENDPNTFGDWLGRTVAGSRKSRGFETAGEARTRDTEYAKSAASTYKSAMDFGTSKALEKRTGLKAFGKADNIAELKAYADRAKTEADNASVEKMLSTPMGISRVKARAKNTYLEQIKQARINNGQSEEQVNSWMEKNASDLDRAFETHFGSVTQAEKEAFAKEEIKQLTKESLAAEAAYDDAKKEAGFVYLVDAYGKGQQNVVNDFDYINEFLNSHPEIASDYGLKKSNGGKYFDAIEMNELRQKAESDSNDAATEEARKEFKKMFDAFERFKGIESEYEAENRKHKIDQANDKFNSGS